MNATNWYHSDGQQTFGPLPEDQIITLIQSGQLTGDHFVVQEGSEDWQPLSASPFASFLGQSAPAQTQPPRPKGVAPAKRTGATPVPARTPAAQSVKQAAAQAHRGLNRNMIILGALALLALGGLGIFIASRMGGNTYKKTDNVTHQITNNSYFTQLVASGVTTEKDLEAVTDIRPFGDGFIGISKEPLTWNQTRDLAKRTGAQILAIDGGPGGSTQTLLDWLVKSFASHLSSTVWVREQGQARVLDGRDILAVTNLDATRRAIIRWGHEPKSSSSDKGDWIELFTGRDVSQWRGSKQENFPDGAWTIENGTLRNLHGTNDQNLVTRESFRDFELEFEWKFSPGGNSGIFYGLREFQLVDDVGSENGKVPVTSCGALSYFIAPNDRKRLKPVGEYNDGRLIVNGNHVEHWINGEKVVEYELGSPSLKSLVAAGQFKTLRGYKAIDTEAGEAPISLQSHGGNVWFRNIRIRKPEATHPQTPDAARESTALFNGKDLTGFRGGNTFDPRKLAVMPEAERSAQIAKWTTSMRLHWRVENGELVNDGQGDFATTEKEFGDFELDLEYKTVPRADSGIYLRGYPQVQIWDSTETDPTAVKLRKPKGSGGLWNNSPGSLGKEPLVRADRPFGEWNKLRILMVGERVSVWLNDQLVVDRAILENQFDRTKPITPRGPIQFQTHGGEIRLRNIRIREIPDGGQPNQQIVGTWISPDKESEWTFADNGIFAYKRSGQSFAGRWTQDGTKISVDAKSTDGASELVRWFEIKSASSTEVSVMMNGERPYTWKRLFRQ